MKKKNLLWSILLAATFVSTLCSAAEQELLNRNVWDQFFMTDTNHRTPTIFVFCAHDDKCFFLNEIADVEANDNYIYAGTMGGAMYSNDNGNDWQQLPLSLASKPIFSVYSITNYHNTRLFVSQLMGLEIGTKGKAGKYSFTSIKDFAYALPTKPAVDDNGKVYFGIAFSHPAHGPEYGLYVGRYKNSTKKWAFELHFSGTHISDVVVGDNNTVFVLPESQNFIYVCHTDNMSSCENKELPTSLGFIPNHLFFDKNSHYLYAYLTANDFSGGEIARMKDFKWENLHYGENSNKGLISIAAKDYTVFAATPYLGLQIGKKHTNNNTSTSWKWEKFDYTIEKSTADASLRLQSIYLDNNTLYLGSYKQDEYHRGGLIRIPAPN